MGADEWAGRGVEYGDRGLDIVCRRLMLGALNRFSPDSIQHKMPAFDPKLPVVVVRFGITMRGYQEGGAIS